MGTALPNFVRNHHVTFQQYSQELLEFVTSYPLVVNVALTFRETNKEEGHIEGRLDLIGGYQLFISEYVFTIPTLRRSKYRYHVQDASGRFVCRWDNAPHHPQIETFPDHCHVAEKVVEASPPMDLPSVLVALSTKLP
jgi:hypothetical protein